MSIFRKIIDRTPLVGHIVNRVEVDFFGKSPKEALKLQIERQFILAGGAACLAAPIAAAAAAIGISVVLSTKEDIYAWIETLTNEQARDMYNALQIIPS